MCLSVYSVQISNTENDYMNQLLPLNNLNEIIYIKQMINILYKKAFIKCVIEIRKYKKININLKFVLLPHILYLNIPKYFISVMISMMTGSNSL